MHAPTDHRAIYFVPLKTVFGPQMRCGCAWGKCRWRTLPSRTWIRLITHQPCLRGLFTTTCGCDGITQIILRLWQEAIANFPFLILASNDARARSMSCGLEAIRFEVDAPTLDCSNILGSIWSVRCCSIPDRFTRVTSLASCNFELLPVASRGRVAVVLITPAVCRVWRASRAVGGAGFYLRFFTLSGSLLLFICEHSFAWVRQEEGFKNLPFASAKTHVSVASSSSSQFLLFHRKILQESPQISLS